MSTFSEDIHNSDLKLMSGYFRIYATSLLISKDIVQIALEFFHIIMKWDKYADDIKGTCTDNVIKIPGDHISGWRTCYSLGVYPFGYHEWKIVVTDNYNNIYIGITRNNEKLDSQCLRRRNQYCITKVESKRILDIVTVIIPDGKLSVSKPHYEQCNINLDKQTQYYLAVSAWSRNTTIKMMSYSTYPQSP